MPPRSKPRLVLQMQSGITRHDGLVDDVMVDQTVVTWRLGPYRYSAVLAEVQALTIRFPSGPEGGEV